MRNNISDIKDIRSRQVRVFTLLPPRPRFPHIRGTLTVVNLDDEPVYEAVSYVWGNANTTEPVFICANDDDVVTGELVKIDVTSNALSALRTLRHKHESRRLWMDAICIDQRSSREKSEQVELMTRIYRCAQTVLICLHAPLSRKEDSRHILRLFRTIGLLYRIKLHDISTRLHLDRFLVAPIQRYLLRRVARAGGTEQRFQYLRINTNTVKDSLSTLLCHDYFERAWTVQEIAMARKIRLYYGTASINWFDFVVSTSLLTNQFSSSDDGRPPQNLLLSSETFDAQRQCLRSHFSSLSAEELKLLLMKNDDHSICDVVDLDTYLFFAFGAGSLRSSLPHDKVYAMRWMSRHFAPHAKECLPKPDYDEDIDEVFAQYTVAMTKARDGRLQPLYYVNSKSRSTSLPSWVPDWSNNSSEKMHHWLAWLSHRNATSLWVTKPAVERHDRMIKVRGLIHDKIESICPLAPFTFAAAEGGEICECNTHLPHARNAQKLIDFLRHDCGYESPEEVSLVIESLFQGSAHSEELASYSELELSLAEKLNVSPIRLRIMLFDELSSRLQDGSSCKDILPRTFKPYINEKQQERINSDFLQSWRPCEVPLAAAMEALDSLSHFRSFFAVLHDFEDMDFFRTSSGLVGVAVQGVQVGDSVALWNGCNCPMIIRQATDFKEECYNLHGPTNVLGIMNGEVWTEEEENWQQFTIV